LVMHWLAPALTIVDGDASDGRRSAIEQALGEISVVARAALAQSRRGCVMQES